MQFMSFLMPLLKLLPKKFIQWVSQNKIYGDLFHKPEAVLRISEMLARHRKEVHESGEALVMTGHSLGAAFAGAASVQFWDVETIGFSAPGLFFQLGRWGLSPNDIDYGFTNLQPTHDMVPRVDTQRG